MLTGDKKEELTPTLFDGFSPEEASPRGGSGRGDSIVKGKGMLARNFELYQNYHLGFFFSLFRDTNELREDYSEVDCWEDIFGKDFIPDRSKPPKNNS